MKEQKIRVSVPLTAKQVDYLRENYQDYGENLPGILKIVIAQLMSGEIGKIYGKSQNSVGRPKKEYPLTQKMAALDDPAGNYYRLTPSQIEDINNADISFVSLKTLRLNVGFWQRDNKGNIVNGNLPYSMIDICTVDEAKRLPPSIKEILDSKFQDDPTGGISADERKRIIAAERDSAFVPKEAETIKAVSDGEQG